MDRVGTTPHYRNDLHVTGSLSISLFRFNILKWFQLNYQVVEPLKYGGAQSSYLPPIIVAVAGPLCTL